MADDLVDFAIALASDLELAVAANAFGMDCTVERTYLPQVKLEDEQHQVDSPPLITVLTRDDQETLETRNKVSNVFLVDVGIQAKVADTAATTIDPYVALTRKIREWFRFHKVTGRNETWFETESQALFSPKHLQELTQYTAVFTAKFRRVS